MEYRADIPPMLVKDWETAENAKVEIEELQRHDRRLREAVAKRRESEGVERY